LLFKYGREVASRFLSAHAIAVMIVVLFFLLTGYALRLASIVAIGAVGLITLLGMLSLLVPARKFSRPFRETPLPRSTDAIDVPTERVDD
ncbi:MAG: hypothetical protein ACFB21_03645, partial [Opitutales bacterium]